jgi:plasmid stabilization system protein ParE
VAEAAGRSIAAELLLRIRDRCVMLAETPGEIGTARPEIVKGTRSFLCPPYVIFFRYRRRAVHVIRILHERQDVDQHFG